MSGISCLRHPRCSICWTCGCNVARQLSLNLDCPPRPSEDGHGVFQTASFRPIWKACQELAGGQPPPALPQRFSTAYGLACSLKNFTITGGTLSGSRWPPEWMYVTTGVPVWDGYKVQCSPQGLPSHMVVKSRTDQRPKQMVSAMAFRGKGSKYITFRYDVFEKCFLRVLSDLKAEDVQPAQLDDPQTELQAAEGRLADLEYRIEKIRMWLATDPDLDSLMDDIAKMQRERKTVAKEAERLKAESHSGGQVRTWRETVPISDLLATTTGEELVALRRRLKARIHHLVKAVST